MPRLALPALLAGALLAIPAPALRAQNPATDEQETVVRVNDAIRRGVAFLRNSYQAPGAGGNHWESFWINNLGNMKGGVTSLVALALLNCGEKPTDPVMASALDFLRGLPPQKTYVVGLQTMVFAEARQPRDLPLIQRNVDWLVEQASRSGGKIAGWSYPLEGAGARPDASNTQYALLGLYAGKQAGARIDAEVWKQLRDLYIRTQKSDSPTTGYWSYIESPARASFTMSAAGVSGLLIAGMGLEDDAQQFDPATGVARQCGLYPENEPLARGLNWVGKHFSFDSALESKSTMYNVYGIERAGRLSGQRFLGRYDWYREGCEFLLRNQSPDGAWSLSRGGSVGVDAARGIATSFALLFLSKGRTPIVVSKLAYGPTDSPERGVIAERAAGGVVGWNRKHNDARNLSEYASRELFGGLPLGWQVYDPRRRDFGRREDILAEVGQLVQSPVLYITGHEPPVLSGQHKEILKKYVEEGGFVFAEACCGSRPFADGFRRLMAELFPETPLKPLPPEHPVWRSHQPVPPGTFPNLQGMDRGCRTVAILSADPLAGYWEQTKFSPRGAAPAANRGELAYRLGGNVIAYATGMEPPKQRLSFTRLVDSTKERTPPRGFLKPAQLRLPGEPPPAPAAMRNLMNYLRDAAKLDAVLQTESLTAGDDDLFKFRFLYMHGRKAFQFTEDEALNLRATVQAGGTLFADACCGSPEFHRAFEALVKQLSPDRPLEAIPLDDPLYSAELNGTAIRTVRRREKADAGPEGGYQELPPNLQGVKIDGRWAIIYSRTDIGCALEGHKSSDCLGHTRESAQRLAAAVVLYALKQ